MHRVTEFPPGVAPPRRVRVYLRNGRHLLQWWEPSQRKNVAERVDGDLIEAVVRARQVEAKLSAFRTSGRVAGRLPHAELVSLFVTDLRNRSDAGEVAPATGRRYDAALAHYRAFAQSPAARQYADASTVDRSFALAFAAFLAERRVAPNGVASGAQRRMKGCDFVWDAVRAMYRWAADPERGNRLGDGFRNPFLRRPGGRPRHAADPFGQPDITVDMAAAFLAACDIHQLRLFVPLVFLGLRAAEPCFLFREYVDGNWLRVPCNAALAYSTKGRRDKRLPLVEPVRSALLGTPAGRGGLLLTRRSVADGRERPPLLGSSLEQLERAFDARLRAAPDRGAAARLRIRDGVLADAGAVDYDRLEAEFHKVAAALKWPPSATPKDFRHLFATSLANAGLPEPYRKYLMGHAPGGREGAIAAYTHLDRLGEQYARVMETAWVPLADAVRRRLADLEGGPQEARPQGRTGP
jgi:integrase